MWVRGAASKEGHEKRERRRGRNAAMRGERAPEALPRTVRARANAMRWTGLSRHWRALLLGTLMKGRPKILEGGRIGRKISSRKALRGQQKATAGNVAWLHQFQSEGSIIDKKIATHLCQCLHRPIPPSRSRSVFALRPIKRARCCLETRTTKARRHTVVEPTRTEAIWWSSHVYLTQMRPEVSNT